MQGLPQAQISSFPIVHREIKIRADPIQDDTTGKPGRAVRKPVDQDARRATRCGQAIPLGREGNGRAAILVKRFAAWEAPSLEMAVRQPMQRVLREAGMWMRKRSAAEQPGFWRLHPALHAFTEVL